MLSSVSIIQIQSGQNGNPTLYPPLKVKSKMADLSQLNKSKFLSNSSSEADPLGKDPHSPGAKLDAGKNRLSLVLGAFSGALQEVGKIGTYGANKYTDNGWRTVPKGVERYSDAMLRHYFAEATEERDKDTELLHAAHLAWNALARLELLLQQNTPISNAKTPSYWHTDDSPEKKALAKFFKSSPQLCDLFLRWTNGNLSQSEHTIWKTILQDEV